jgi:preprotein translocase subunit SecG
MTLLINFLTLVLVLDCMLLILLVLIQLPKKEAGMGTAFGGGTTDALFGAGAGNALTNLTKYAAGVFLVLAMSLSVLNTHRMHASRDRIQQELQKRSGGTSLPPRTAPEPALPGAKAPGQPASAPLFSPPSASQGAAAPTGTAPAPGAVAPTATPTTTTTTAPAPTPPASGKTTPPSGSPAPGK